jgi:hypothetical protein
MHGFTVVNAGWTAITVVGAGRDGPGLSLQAVSTDPDGKVALPLPSTVEPGGTLTFVLRYRVTDCAAVPAEPWPVPIRVQRPWGVQSVYVAIPTHTSRHAPEGMRSYSGRDPWAVEWQRDLADEDCELPQ